MWVAHQHRQTDSFNWDTNPHTPRLYFKPAPPLVCVSHVTRGAALFLPLARTPYQHLFLHERKHSVSERAICLPRSRAAMPVLLCISIVVPHSWRAAVIPCPARLRAHRCLSSLPAPAPQASYSACTLSSELRSFFSPALIRLNVAASLNDLPCFRFSRLSFSSWFSGHAEGRN